MKQSPRLLQSESHNRSRSGVLVLALVAAITLSACNNASGENIEKESSHAESHDGVTVVYKWTAQPEKLGELTEIYRNVTQAMKDNEPGALAVQLYVSEVDNAIYVRDDFADAEALGFHLSTTAAEHFPQLLEIATPGAFLFFGNVPDDLKQATLGMGLAAEFATHETGFER